MREGRPEISGTRGHDSSAQVPEIKRHRVHEEVLNKKETAENIIHGSDSVESAERELAIYFPDGLL